MQAPALRPAGKPERDPGRTELAATGQDTALPQALRAHGPPSDDGNESGAGRMAARRETRCTL